MKVTGFYKLSQDYIELTKKVGGKYDDYKIRTIYCCFQDEINQNIFWAIPTSSTSPSKLECVKRYCAYKDSDIRSCYYHIGYTNKPAIFKISSAMPVPQEYLTQFFTRGEHLILENNKIISELDRKLRRILVVEKDNPNKFEQRITDIYNYLTQEECKTIKIKELLLDELEQAFPLVSQLRTHLSFDEYIKLVKTMRADGYRAVGLYKDGKLVSYAGFARMINLYYGEHIWVYELVTGKTERGKGYGKLLLEYIEKYAWDNSLTCVALSSGLHREDAHRFYESHMDYEKMSYVFKKDLQKIK